MPLRFERTFGAYPISIATSLALEGISHTGEYLDRGPKPPVNNMECIMVNLRTLIRNVIGAFPTTEQLALSDRIVYQSCKDDLDAFTEYVLGFNANCEVVLYVSTYDTINKDFKEVNFKKFETVKQLALESIERSVVNRFRDNDKELLTEFDYKLSSLKRCVLLTHHPIDLLSYYSFPDLTLLESHTGILKERKDWYTKLNLPKGCTTIPFNRAMLCIFGDKVFINGQLPKVKKAIISVSEKYTWNPLVTVSKQIADCKRANEPHLGEFINQYK